MFVCADVAWVECREDPNTPEELRHQVLIVATDAKESRGGEKLRGVEAEEEEEIERVEGEEEEEEKEEGKRIKGKGEMEGGGGGGGDGERVMCACPNLRSSMPEAVTFCDRPLNTLDIICLLLLHR